MSKILILSTPYNGTTHFGECLARDLEYRFFDQPLDNTAPTKWKSPNGSGTLFEFDLPRGHSLHNVEKNYTHGFIGYNYPDDVLDNSIVNHFFGWHKLPNNFNETQFLDTFIPKFDYVITLRCEDISYNWKQHLAAINAQEHNGNWMWLKWLHQSQNWEYKDSYYDQEIVDRYESAHNSLVNYIIEKNMPCINIDTEIWDYEFDFDHLRSLFSRFAIPGLMDQSDDGEFINKNTNVLNYFQSAKWPHCMW